MTSGNRVVWSEGMFLRTQHFQQQERWVEELLRGAVGGLRGYPWGFRRLKLNTALLGTGKVGLVEADAVFPDGTPIDLPRQAAHPLPLVIGETTPEGIVYLALPEQQPGGVAIEPAGTEDVGARWRGEVVEIGDHVAGSAERTAIEIARPKLRFVHERQDRAGLVGLGVCRVRGVQADGAVVLDTEWLPPSLSIAAHPQFEQWLDDLEGKLESIAVARARFLVDPTIHGAGEVFDLMVLQLVNRLQPLLRHLALHKTAHPEDLFGILLSLAGEAATFTSERRSPPLPSYRHENPAAGYRPLVELLRPLLVELARPVRKAIPIPLKVHARAGVRTTEAPDPMLFAQARFLLAVKAALPAERVRLSFPRQVTIGPAEEFQDLWNARLQGIDASSLPVAPRQIPYHAGMVYFELDRTNPYWRKLQTSAGLAIGVTGDWPELEMECWAIRD